LTADALGVQRALPEEILKAVAARLEDQDARVRGAAAYALGRRPALPEEILKAVAARLQDQKAYVRRTAALCAWTSTGPARRDPQPICQVLTPDLAKEKF